MLEKIKIEEIYDKNISFLIGSGASYGLLPTLALNIRALDGSEHTIESLSTRLEAEDKQPQHCLLFMHYYKKCIEPAITLDPTLPNSDPLQVLAHYESFLTTLLSLMGRSRSAAKRINLFTTNYDGCFELAADSLYSAKHANFILNDGSRGFISKYLHSRFFNSYSYQSGTFDHHHTDIPQLNLIHLHGSIYWKKQNKRIAVDYGKQPQPLIDPALFTGLIEFSEVLNSDTAIEADLDAFGLSPNIRQSFWRGYNELPVVNPTKWKFHETLFEEHYYQMLRLLSYELEKPNSILISFGFSFADEHILHLVQRSLSSPHLQLFICCFNEGEEKSMKTKFREFDNVSFVGLNGRNLGFSEFNSEVFTLSPSSASPT